MSSRPVVEVCRGVRHEAVESVSGDMTAAGGGTHRYEREDLQRTRNKGVPGVNAHEILVCSVTSPLRGEGDGADGGTHGGRGGHGRAGAGTGEGRVTDRRERDAHP